MSEEDYIFVISDLGYIWRSTDKGLSFTKINQYGCAVVVYDLAFNSMNELLAFSSNGICKSTDFGNNWDYLNEDFIFNPIHNTIVKDKNGNLIIGDYNVLFKSFDNGCNWVLTNKGLNYKCTYQIDAFHKTNSLYTYHSSINEPYPFYFYNINCNNNNYDSIIPVGLMDEIEAHKINSINVMRIDSNDNIYIMQASPFSYIYCSTNYGKEWNLFNKINTTRINDFYFGNDGLILIQSSDSNYIYKSTDYGDNWNINIVNGGPYYYLELFNENFFIAYGLKNGISISTNYGDTWYNSYLKSQVYGVAVDRNMNIYASSGLNLYQSTNLGESWSITNNSLPIDCPRLLMSNNDVLYAISISSYYRNGVYRSADYGKSWEHINSGLEDVSVKDYTIAQDGHIYLATSRFVFRSKEPVNSVDENIDAVKNEVNVFPNPLSNSGEVKFELEQAGIIEVKIYDILGNPLQTIFKGTKEAGLNKIQFSTEQFSSGVYYIVINSGSNKYVEKFVKF